MTNTHMETRMDMVERNLSLLEDNVSKLNVDNEQIHSKIATIEQIVITIAKSQLLPLDGESSLAPIVTTVLAPEGPSSLPRSQLKCVYDDHPIIATLPPQLIADEPSLVFLEFVLDRRSIMRNGQRISQVLVQWQGKDKATWMDSADIKGQFTDLNLEDKTVLLLGGKDRYTATDEISRGKTTHGLRVYSRRAKRIPEGARKTAQQNQLKLTKKWNWAWYNM
ncbi:hypothetical protein GH714_004192 [Hevea brasiliensis]|uniref:Chromo domain-containing protein n=1 Tax=Hevea brasiliensis TaxID=3981 RepID=A0A6A6MWJ7_HEVBR|nr:hypothetical protein GH714_004192 [Hevea brasiliensis]